MSVVFWDFDGTLVHSTHLWSNSIYEALLSVDPHTTMTFEQVRICNRRGFTWQTPNEDYRHLIGDAWWEFMNRHVYESYRSYGVSHETAAEASQRVREIIKQPHKYELYPDTKETLLKTRELGHQNILLSNNYPDLDIIIDALGLSSLLDGAIISALEGYDKPRLELFSLAKERFPAEHYYIVGDNPTADIDGGHSAAMTTILVHNSTPYAKADYCFDTLSPCVSVFEVE